jgi:hypothetical protein
MTPRTWREAMKMENYSTEDGRTSDGGIEVRAK